jgi:hypothetical protein
MPQKVRIERKDDIPTSWKKIGGFNRMPQKVRIERGN